MGVPCLFSQLLIPLRAAAIASFAKREGRSRPLESTAVYEFGRPAAAAQAALKKKGPDGNIRRPESRDYHEEVYAARNMPRRRVRRKTYPNDSTDARVPESL
jgi:hypothetical protein